jgi:hypothetical protein
MDIVFQHSVALMYHLYTFTYVLNATLFTVALSRGIVVVKALCFKPEGRGFDMQ